MANFTITPETGFKVRAPTLFYFAGSTACNTWNLLRLFTITSNTTSYNYYRIVIDKVNGGGVPTINVTLNGYEFLASQLGGLFNGVGIGTTFSAAGTLLGVAGSSYLTGSVGIGTIYSLTYRLDIYSGSTTNVARIQSGASNGSLVYLLV